MNFNGIMSELTIATHEVHIIKKAMEKAAPDTRIQSVCVCWVTPKGNVRYKGSWFYSTVDTREYVKRAIAERKAESCWAWVYVNDELEWKQM